ncbi:hypothetical protein AGABI1DRAFT_107098 [Agaricus bisporus var. burnettii JB137-S8]|uniref:ABC transporter domain-containing protein n=1 Tax=Agaricus bisporus var. burnettii (strain JB137-S8 / ATCC MYA-4627 / FGSC 10392) TaxID=597362 RepID=K5XWT0_AGABU|nr:uncharacterized protein AGABI1DRAFT_107098 [Agaricus bisporus var. burnettii JB137-S8]EKM79705.1 hypothetical protein AGABI1DRAFT_107098 [Agaricus bisporus var. burnettii JB137-S8]
MSKDYSKNEFRTENPGKKTTISEQYGIWHVLSTPESLREKYRRLFLESPKALPSLYKLLRDIYCLSPMQFILFSSFQVWTGCQDAIKMHFSSQVLRMIEQRLRDGVPNGAAICYFLFLRLAVAALEQILSWYNDNVLERLEHQTTCHFQMRLMKDLIFYPTEKPKVTADQAWSSFEGLLHFFTLAVKVVSQFTLIFHLSRSGGGPLFSLICLLQPIVSIFIGEGAIWDKVCIIRNNNKYHQRMGALVNLTEREYREDVIKYQKANERLGNVPVKSVWSMFSVKKTPYPQTLLSLLGELPIVYCGLLSLLRPTSTSFATIAILQESSALLVMHVSWLFSRMESFKGDLQSIHEIYQYEVQGSSEITIGKKVISSESAKVGPERGMQFELRNVSFAYPGSQTTKDALRNINLTIKSGQFVVIVGSNGSGKSTLVKLLLRLYSPSKGSDKPEKQNTSGEILIDNEPASSYPENSLRQSTAVLSQGNLIYPGFSLGENIGLGFSQLLSDEEALNIAAEKAGAKEVLKRMKDGANTILDPLEDYYEFNIKRQSEEHPLKKALEELRRPVEVSGGEKQRIVAARTFMKFNSGKIRFLAVDEPSSALDAEGEDFLLNSLLKEREGKTIVFVTHRFGKLTKQADLIICMKEGAIVESGMHVELMKNDGEYKKLYDIQASAFRDDVEPEIAASLSDEKVAAPSMVSSSPESRTMITGIFRDLSVTEALWERVWRAKYLNRLEERWLLGSTRKGNSPDDEDPSLEVHVMYPDSGLKYESKELEKTGEEPEKYLIDAATQQPTLSIIGKKKWPDVFNAFSKVEPLVCFIQHELGASSYQ